MKSNDTIIIIVALGLLVAFYFYLQVNPKQQTFKQDDPRSGTTGKVAGAIASLFF